MFLRGGSSRNNIAMEESLTRRRFDSVRSMNPNTNDMHDGDDNRNDDGYFQGDPSMSLSLSPPCEEAPPAATTSSRTSGNSNSNNGQQRFFRRHGSQPTLRWLGGNGNGATQSSSSNNNKSKRRLLAAPATPKSTTNQSLSTSITSHTSTSPTSYSNYSSSLASPGGGGGILGHQRGLLSSMSPAKKKPSQVLSSGDSNDDQFQVPRIIVAGPSPPLVAAGGEGGGVNKNSGSTSSHSSTGTPSSPRRTTGAASTSRPQIYVPHLNDTVSTFDSNHKKGTTTTGIVTGVPAPMLTPPAPAPMDYCHHVPNSPAPSRSPRRNPKTSTTCSPYVVTGQAPSSATAPPPTSLPRRLPSDDDWTPNSGTPRHQYQRHHSTKRSDSNDEDTDIHDGDTDIHDYDDDDYDDDGRSASVCDTLHNSLGTDSFRLPKPSNAAASSSVSVSVSVSTSGVFCCEDSYHNYSSSVGTESFRLPNPYSVCDESLHNSSSMGTDSHRRRRRFDRAMSDDDNVVMDDYETHRYDSYRDVSDQQQQERHSTGATPAARAEEAKVVDVEEDSKMGGTAGHDSDDQSLSPEDVVEVPPHRFPPTRPVQEPARAPNGLSSAPSRPSSGRDGAAAHSPPRGSAAVAAAKSPSSTEALSASSIIEIFPGCKVPLRGSRETWGSFRDGTAVLVPCTACLNCVYCVPDVTMVLCPHCRDISPLATTVDNLNAEASVGLGMSVHESRSLMGA